MYGYKQNKVFSDFQCAFIDRIDEFYLLSTLLNPFLIGDF